MSDKVKLRDIVAKNIKACRIRAGLSQSGLAKRAKFSTRYIQQLERCPGKNVTLDTVEHVADALGLNASELTNTSRQSRMSKREQEALETSIKVLQSIREQVS